MRPTWDVDGSMAEDEVAVIHLDATEPGDERGALATVLAARCHVTLLEAASRGGPTVSDRVEEFRQLLAGRSPVRGAAARRRIERAIAAVETGRTGQVADAELTALVDDLRVLEASLRGPADSAR